MFFFYFCNVIQIEICAPSRVSAEAARAGGAERIELCRDLDCGGLTPSQEDILYCIRELRLCTHVLLRPRPGNFYYNRAEVEEIMADIARCREMGVAAVVVGFLNYNGCIDTELTRRAVEVAAPMEVTFHRAFDEACQDPVEALNAVVGCGCTRLLTSGMQPTAPHGVDILRRLVDCTRRSPIAERGFKVLVGSGVTPQNAQTLLQATGADELHASCKRLSAEGKWQTDASQVHSLIQACR